MIWCNLKRFHGTKYENLNNWCDKNLFIAPFVMHIGMVAGVGRRRSLRCFAIRSLGIRRRPAPTRCHVVNLSSESVT